MRAMLCGTILMVLAVAGTAADLKAADEKKLMDAELAGKVPLVLRVELLKPAQGVEKYGYDEVKVLQVYKNETGFKIPGEVTIAFRNTDTGLLPGVTTVYLVDYRTPADGKLWRIEGRSHLEKK